MRIDLPWQTPPLSGNRTRGNPHARALEVDQAKSVARHFVRMAEVQPVDRAEVWIHYRPATRRRCDADNLAPTLKVCQDALVLENVLPDDSWRHVPRSGHEIHPPDADLGAGMWLEVVELLADAGYGGQA